MIKLSVDARARGLIFDLDGTIADTMPVHYEVYKRIFGDYGVDFSYELFIALAGVPAAGIFRKVNELHNLNLDAEEMGHYKEEEYEKLMHTIRPIEPVAELVRANFGKLPMAVGTGSIRRLAWKTLNIIGLGSYIEFVVSADDVTHHKPHPETFLKCAELMEIEPKFCQVFEDGQPGMEAAKIAGMMAVNVTTLI